MNYQLNELMKFESEEDDIIADFRESAFGLMQQNQGEEPRQSAPLSSMAMPMMNQGQPMMNPAMMPPQMIGQPQPMQQQQPTPAEEPQGLDGQPQYLG